MGAAAASGSNVSGAANAGADAPGGTAAAQGAQGAANGAQSTANAAQGTAEVAQGFDKVDPKATPKPLTPSTDKVLGPQGVMQTANGLNVNVPKNFDAKKDTVFVFDDFRNKDQHLDRDRKPDTSHGEFIARGLQRDDRNIVRVHGTDGEISQGLRQLNESIRSGELPLGARNIVNASLGGFSGAGADPTFKQLSSGLGINGLNNSNVAEHKSAIRNGIADVATGKRAAFEGLSQPHAAEFAAQDGAIRDLQSQSLKVLHAGGYYERQASVEDSLGKAILKYGTPLKLFVDNAWVYSGTTFGLACSQLGIVKIHSTPRYPVSRGKQERVFATLRQQLLDEMENLEPMPLAQMNRYLVAWVDRYNHTPHSRTRQTPHERFAGRPHRMVPLDQFEEAFWQWDTRAISPLGEIKFAGNTYHVDSALAAKKAVIRYDPNDLSRIHVWKDGRKVATATPHRLIHQQRRGRPRPGHAKASRAALNYLNQLEQSHRQRLARELNLTDYREPNPNKEETP